MQRKFKGRPNKFTDANSVKENIMEYFKECEENKILPTVTGIAISLGISTRQLRDYKNCLENIELQKQLSEDEKKELSSVIKQAYMFVEESIEQQMLDPNSKKNPAALIFMAKNFGWVDKTEVEQIQKTIHVTLED